MITKGICHLTLIPIRANPESKSEMVTQLLFGETYQVLASNKDWYFIQNNADHYKGWMSENQFYPLIENDLNANFTLTYFPYSEIKTINGLVRAIPGSKISKQNDGYYFNGSPCHFEKEPTVNNFDIIDFAKQFLNSPYLWGGKSMMGIDCSGFTSVIFACFGIQLYRDASEQVLQGDPVDFINEIKPADLVFFANSEDKITHVGIAINQDQIIHASGCVRLDSLDSYGIFNAETKTHTHTLKCIRRII
jgi:hypothetical protein